MKNIFDVLKISKEEREPSIDIDLNDQTKNLRSLLNKLSDDLGIFEEAEARARSAKLEVAAKFAAVEKLLKQTETVMDLLTGNNEAVPSASAMPVNVAVHAPEPVSVPESLASTELVRMRNNNGYVIRVDPLQMIREAVMSLGGTSSSSQIVSEMSYKNNISNSRATTVFYKYKDRVLDGYSRGTISSWAVKKEYANN